MLPDTNTTLCSGDKLNFHNLMEQALIMLVAPCLVVCLLLCDAGLTTVLIAVEMSAGRVAQQVVSGDIFEVYF